MENLKLENLKANLLRLANSDPNKPLTPSETALLEKKILLAFPTLKTPTHPTYAVMIENAINNLNEPNGSSEESISKYIKEKYEGLPWAHDTYLRHHLNKLSEDGEIVIDNTTKCYTIARAVAQDSKSNGKRPTRVYFTFQGERKECGKGKEKVVVERSEIPTGVQGGGNGKSKGKGRRRRLVSKNDDGVRGDPKVVSEKNESVGERSKEELGVRNGDDFIKDGNVIVCDKECEVEVKFERDNERNDDTSPGNLTILPFEIEKSSSTLSTGGDDYGVDGLVSNLEEFKLATTPLEGSNGMSLSGEMSENGERNFPMIVCGLEDVSKQKQLVHSRKKGKGPKETKKVSSGSTPKRSKVNQVNKKVSPMSKPSSSALAVSHNELERGPENKEFVELPQEPILMEEEENMPLQKVLEKYNKQKHNTLQNALEIAPLAIEATSDCVSKLQLDPENTEIPNLLLMERETSPQKEANLFPDETESGVSPIDKTENYVGPSDSMQIEVGNEPDRALIGSPMLEQSVELEGYEHKIEDQENQENEFEEENRSILGQNCEKLKIKLRRSLRKKLEISKDDLSNVVHDDPQEGLCGPTTDHPSKKSGPGGAHENLEPTKEDEEASSRSLLKEQEDQFELETVTNSIEKVKLLKKDGRGRPKKVLESLGKTRGRGRPRKVVEAGKQDTSSSSKLDIGVWAGSSGPETGPGPVSMVKGRKKKKNGRGRPPNDDVTAQEKEGKVEVCEKEEVEDQKPNLGDEFHVSELEKSKSEVLGTCETQLGVPLSNDEINQANLEGKGGPEMDSPGRAHKEKEGNLEGEGPNPSLSDENCVIELEKSKSGDISVYEIQVVPPFDDGKLVNELGQEQEGVDKEVFESGDGLAKNKRLGRPRKIKKDSDKEELHEQEKELKGDVCKQSEIEVEDSNEKQLAKEQAEVQNSHEFNKKRGESEGQTRLLKTKSPKVIVSSNYPLRSRMNHQSQ